jgi:membrane associated rhomboid family serine protease
MTLWKTMYPRWKDLPPVTMLLALSCLVISIPLLLSQELYAILGYGNELGNDYWKLITSNFAHGNPASTVLAPLPHLLGNFFAIILLGALIERVLGSGRFFLLTLATFTTHTVWKALYGNGNGASGFCWGYVVLAAPILFWESQTRKKQVFRDPLYVGIVLLSAFMVVGVATVLGILGFELWNGTNQAHVISVLTALPFVFLWRNIMRENWQRLEQGQPIERDRPLLNTVAIGVSVLLLVFNVTFAAIGISVLKSGTLVPPQVVSMTPQSGNVETLNQYDQQVTIRFDKPMAARVHVERISISWMDDKERLDYSYHWEDPQTLVFVFNREVYESETILLIADVRDAGWGQMIPVKMVYQ